MSPSERIEFQFNINRCILSFYFYGTNIFLYGTVPGTGERCWELGTAAKNRELLPGAGKGVQETAITIELIVLHETKCKSSRALGYVCLMS